MHAHIFDFYISNLQKIDRDAGMIFTISQNLAASLLKWVKIYGSLRAQISL